MAGKSAVLAVVIVGDSKDAIKVLNQLGISVEQAEATTKKAGKSMTKVWTAVTGATLLAVRAAGQLEAATQGVATIFGDQADEMMEWAEGMAQYGLSTAEAAAASAVLGAQLKNTGATTEQMTQITQGLIETASALAYTLGGTAVEAVQAMGAALRGEFDTLERYGITLTADAVATEAARLASEGYTFATEQQAKMVATLSLIQQSATLILGESTDATVTAREATDHLRASISNLAAEIVGPLVEGALGPMFEGLADVIDQLVIAIDESGILATVSNTLAGVLTAVSEILDPVLNEALSLVNTLLDKLAAFIEEYVNPVLEVLANALDAVADALSVVIGWVQDAINWFDAFTDSVHEAIDALTFWNDTYDPNAATPSEVVAGLPEAARRGGPGAGAHAAQPQTININVTGATDPYALARLLTRQLEEYSTVQGRKAGQPLAGAW